MELATRSLRGLMVEAVLDVLLLLLGRHVVQADLRLVALRLLAKYACVLGQVLHLLLCWLRTRLRGYRRMLLSFNPRLAARRALCVAVRRVSIEVIRQVN